MSEKKDRSGRGELKTFPSAAGRPDPRPDSPVGNPHRTESTPVARPARPKPAAVAGSDRPETGPAGRSDALATPAVRPLPGGAAKPEPAELVPRLVDQGYGARDVASRRRWVERRTGARLEHVGRCSVPGEAMRGNIENPIGAAQVPLGVAGPLAVDGEHARGVFYVPLATTEGVLVRSYERGMTALTRAGGAVTRLYGDENRVAPIFLFDGVAEARGFCLQLDELLPEVRAAAESTTRHGRLLRLEARPLGRAVMVNFCYSTGDAHGMNMIAKATDKACRLLLERTAARRYTVFSGMDSEKRASGALFAGGKGKKVPACRPAWCAPTCTPRRPRCASSGSTRCWVTCRPAPSATTATTPTASRRCSSPAARTSPTSPTRRWASPISR